MNVYHVDVYKNDHKTLLETHSFTNIPSAKQYARLHKPSVVFITIYTTSDGVHYNQEIASYGWEDDDD